MTDLFRHPVHQFQPCQNAFFFKAETKVTILRGDLFHPWIQGNKWYKLRHFAQLAEENNAGGFISTGGAWSNHLLALARYATERKLQARFYIRGAEEEWKNHPPILKMKEFGAVLKAISRSEYRLITQGKAALKELVNESDFPEVPPGASAPEVVRHTADWATFLHTQADFTDLVLPVASGGTMAGMLAGLPEEIRVHGIDVLNSKGGLVSAVRQLLENSGLKAKASMVWHDAYHFGSYARNHPMLADFIASLQERDDIPLEHVYSGKAFFAVSDLIAKGHFPKGSKILFLHTGGLFQWN